MATSAWQKAEWRAKTWGYQDLVDTCSAGPVLLLHSSTGPHDTEPNLLAVDIALAQEGIRTLRGV